MYFNLILAVYITHPNKMGARVYANGYGATWIDKYHLWAKIIEEITIRIKVMINDCGRPTI